MKSDQPESLKLLERVALGLDLLPVIAFLTDPQNRIVWVNRAFARTIGDPVREKLPPEMRFVPAAVAGPYRDRFPRWKTELSRCLSGLYREVDAGNLNATTLSLIDETLERDEDLRRATMSAADDWDGTMVVRDPSGSMTMVREHVVAVEDTGGKASGFHASLWFPAEAEQRELLATADALQRSVRSLLTPRQLEVARLYASGLSSGEVAAGAGISWRTARDHLEQIYDRLGVHSRAELALLLAREGLV